VVNSPWFIGLGGRGSKKLPRLAMTVRCPGSDRVTLSG
jgi:hypothetical protein